MTKPKKVTKRRKGQPASKAMLSAEERITILENKISEIEKKIESATDGARYAGQAADAALYVANYCR